MIIVDIDAASGTVIEREPTPEELAQRAIDENALAIEAELEADKAAKQKADRDAAIVHAKTLGFTDAMIAVMYPNLMMEA